MHGDEMLMARGENDIARDAGVFANIGYRTDPVFLTA
jgi:hypothetical protein